MDCGAGRAGSAAWDGDLKHFCVRVWPEDGDLAALVTARGGDATLWMNPRFVAGEVGWLVYLWARIQAASGAVVSPLWADELPLSQLPPDTQRMRA